MENNNNQKSKNRLIAIITGVAGIALIILLIFISNQSFKSKTDTELSAPTQSSLDKLKLPQLSQKVAKDEAEVEMQTTAGNITIKLFPKIAPMAVENFLGLAKKDYYNNNEFFRVIKDFMIQSGDPSNKGMGGKVIDSVNKGKSFDLEKSDQLYNIRGALSLANTGAPNSSSSQFFIVQNKQNVTTQIQSPVPAKIKQAYEKGGSPSLDGKYTVFGQVIGGMDVVDKIATGKVKANAQGEQSSPEEAFKITGIKVLKDYKF